MAAALVPVIARQQWMLLRRDLRLALLGIALVFVLATAALTGAALHGSYEADRRAAEAEEARVWAAQGPANPHGAAHFGRYVYKPLSPLATLDPGLLPQLGTSLLLEAHAQNPARGRAIDGGTALDRFAGLSPAMMLQVLAPLLLILAGFSTFAGERARSLLRQELAAGVRPAALIAGRLAGLAAMVASLLLLVAAAGGAALAITGASAASYAALGWMLLGYGLYLMTFVALTIAASAAFPSARTALVVLLAFWATATLLVPRTAPAAAEAASPTLSGPALEALVTKEVLDGPSGHDTRDARLERLKTATMKRYGVAKMENLPVDFGGIALFHGEALSTAIYRRHFAALYDGYDRQAGVQRLFAVLSPLQVIRPWSSALAASDQHAHRRFLEQADAYRYTVVQRLNQDIIDHRKPAHPGGNTVPYVADVAAVTRGLSLDAHPPLLSETLRRHWIDLLGLTTWLALATLLAFAAGRRLSAAAA